MMLDMNSFRSRRAALRDFEKSLDDRLAQIPALVESALPHHRTRGEQVALTAGWITGGIGVLALGLIAGRELRSRYKFSRRTPYDFYAHSGEGATNDLEFGVGI